MGALERLKELFILDFVRDQRYMYIVKGLRTTLLVTFLALILGLILGILVAVIRTAHDQVDKKKLGGFPRFLLTFMNTICRVYLTVIRGTPAMVQLLLMYFVFLASSTNKVLVAVLSFGINSGAYVAEIMRSGIMSIDKGQFEASRSLGFGYKDTMLSVILPQAFKNVLPALGNEVIVLVKETSVAAYVGIAELTYTGNFVISRTYEAFFPLISVAIIYLTLVLILTFFQKKLEKRLRNSDH